VLAACAALAWAAAAAGGRAPAVYAVSVTGSLSTSAYVPAREVDGCVREGGTYVQTLAFRSTRPARVDARAAQLTVPIRVSADWSAGGTRDHWVECPDGQATTLHVDWRPVRRLNTVLTLHVSEGRLWLDGVPEDISGACFGAATPANPLPLAGVYAELPGRVLSAGRRAQVRVSGEEDEHASSDECVLVRSVRWHVTFRRVR
jgi:hypothetical protein